MTPSADVVNAAFAGWACHLVFQRFEPTDPRTHFALLVAIPAALSSLTARHSTSVTFAIASTFTVYLCALLLATIAYRLSPFHPLARYPGPLAAKLTKLWAFRLARSGTLHKRYRQLHRQYGDVLRVGPNELSFCTKDAIAPIMGAGAMPKSPYWDGRCPGQGIKPMIAIRDAKYHAIRRRPWARAFTPAAVKEYEVIVARRATQLVEALVQSKHAIDLAQWISYFSYDVMGNMAFGEVDSTELLREGDVDGLWHALERAQPMANTLGLLPWLGPYFLMFPSFGKGLKNFRASCVSRAAKRKSQGSVSKDLFRHLIDEPGIEPHPPPMAQVVADAAMAVLAGSDTTSTVLSNVFFYLLVHPEPYARLRAEVDAFFPPGESALDTSKHKDMPYLNAVINEALRLHPPVSDGSSRAPAPGSGGRLVGSSFVPEGTTVAVHTYSLQRDPRYFHPHPDAFWPERWLPEGAALTDAAAFVPFSHGPENCVGKSLALLEMRMVVCLLVQMVDLRLEDGFRTEDWGESLMNHYVLTKGALPVVATRRI